ncbi:hypothetical protein [Mycolicibacterium fortuitum]|uniref:hypothetical protein n=1 Tax=Mycolicibacterium fortuitum TaxID=1766 RepID=UPI001F2E66ED
MRQNDDVIAALTVCWTVLGMPAGKQRTLLDVAGNAQVKESSSAIENANLQFVYTAAVLSCWHRLWGGAFLLVAVAHPHRRPAISQR